MTLLAWKLLCSRVACHMGYISLKFDQTYELAPKKKFTYKHAIQVHIHRHTYMHTGSFLCNCGMSTELWSQNSQLCFRVFDISVINHEFLDKKEEAKQLKIKNCGLWPTNQSPSERHQQFHQQRSELHITSVGPLFCIKWHLNLLLLHFSQMFVFILCLSNQVFTP